MMNDSKAGNDGLGKSRRAVLLAFLMMASLFVSAVPYASASHTTQYGVQRDPLYISIGDLDCDGDNDIASGSGFGHFLRSQTMTPLGQGSEMSPMETE